MAAVSSTFSHSKHDVMYNSEEIDLSQYADLIQRIAKAFVKHGINVSIMEDTTRIACEKIIEKGPEIAKVMHNIESKYTLDDELKALIANYLNMKNVKEIQYYEKQVANGRSILEKALKINNPTEKQAATIAKAKRFLPKHEKSLEEAKKLGERVSTLEKVEAADNLNDLMRVVFERGVYYIFKFLYCVELVPVPRSLAEGQKSVIHSQADERDKVSTVSESEKINLHYEVGSTRVNSLFDGLKKVSSYGSELGETEVNYRLKRTEIRIRKVDMGRMAFISEGSLRRG